MADQPVAMKHCSNCKRYVAEGNFVMHEIHCRKNIVLCSKCKEPVPKVSMEQHVEENHALVNCELCSRLVERSRMEEHKSSLCSKRSQVCAFCELSVPADELGRHESYCGTRTELCTKCLQYIMHKDRKVHEESDCCLPERIEPAPKVEANPFDLPEYAYFDHPDYWSDYQSFANDVRRSDFERERRERFVPDFSDYVDPPLDLDGFDSRRNADARQTRNRNDILHLNNETFKEDKLCNDFLKFAQAKKSNASRDPKVSRDATKDPKVSRDATKDPKVSRDATKAPKVSRDVHSNLEPLQDITLLPCEFCDETYPSDEIFEHQVICSSQFDEPDFQVKRDYGSNLLKDHIADPQPPKTSFVESLSDAMAMLPCEFCEDLYPTEDLMFHQMNCDVRQLIAGDEPQVHSEDLRRPPSLPSGLNLVNDVSNTPPSMKPSSSIPLHLSQLGMTSNPSSAPRKPIPAATGYRQRIPAAGRGRPSYKLPSDLAKLAAMKQLSLEGQAGHGSQEVQPGRQYTEAGSVRRLGPGMATVPNTQLQAGSLGHGMANVGNIPLQEWLLPSRSNARDATHATQRTAARGKPTSVSEIPAATLPDSNHSRPAGPSRVDRVATRPGRGRPEGQVVGRPNRPPMERSNSQKTNSRTLPDPPSK